MFYSHQILARNGPLATVWIAAHLHHRLKKSHCTATDIPSTVDRIMDPEVPIALRLSSYLMLGVVRIYSMKVEYVYRYCKYMRPGIINKKTDPLEDINLSEDAANPMRPGIINKNIDPPEDINLSEDAANPLRPGIINKKTDPPEDINLSEDAANPPPEAVTLSETLDFDALHSDYYLGREGEEDGFLTSPDQIRLHQRDVSTEPGPSHVLGHAPIERSGYVPIFLQERFDDDVPGQDLLPQLHVDGSVVSGGPVQTDHAEITSPRLNVPTDSDVRPMEEDIIPPPPVDANGGLEDPSSSNQRNSEERSPQSVPEIEAMREAVHDFHPINNSLWAELQNNLNEVQSPRDQVTTEREMPSPLLDNILVPGGQSSSFENHFVQPTSSNSTEDPVILGHTSPELVPRSTPPVQRPQPRARRRRFLFDQTVVLRNAVIMASLNDALDISRKRKPCPVSVLGDWQRRTRRKMEGIFDEPSVTPLCPDLCNLFKKDYITAKAHLLRFEEATPGQPRTSRSSASVPDIDIETEHLPAAGSPAPPPDLDRVIEPRSPARISDLSPDMEIERPIRAHSPAAVGELDMEIERPRQPDGNDGSNVFQEFMSSPTRFTGSPIRNDDLTPPNIGSDHQGETTYGARSLPTPNMASVLHFGSEMEAPNTYGDEEIVVENNAPYDLSFLEADSSPKRSPTTGSRRTQQTGAFSTRTRATEQFLEGHSPAIQVRENLTDDLSVNQILQGQDRKICARMFYQTLVLKSLGRIDVHQEEPYGDIHLKLNPELYAQC